jgi:hypothetical protein
MTLDVKIKKLSELAESDSRYPFPYDGCRKIRKTHSDQLELLIPHLDLYLMEIAGNVSYGKKILGWSKEQVTEAKAKMNQSFFDKRPEYRFIESSISNPDTPDLYFCLQIYDQMRMLIVEICNDLENR